MVDHYRVLGVSRDASSDDIKAAFRRLALKFHPDRHANATQSEQRRASDSFREVKDAYEVLGDDRKRDVYNRSGTRYSNPGSGASSSSSTYSAAQAARGAYARSAEQNRQWHQRNTGYWDGSSSSSRSSDWTYRQQYSSPKYSYTVRWRTYQSPVDGARMALRATLFGMAVVTILLVDSMTGSAPSQKNNTAARRLYMYTQKTYEQMVQRVEQEKRAATARASKAEREQQ